MLTRRAAQLVAVAALVAGCSPFDVSIDDRRAALAPGEAARADEILSRPLTLDLGLDPARAVFDDDGVARIDAQRLDWALQGVRRVPSAVAAALDGERGLGLDDGEALDAATAGASSGAVDGAPVVLVSDQQGIRWTTTFTLDATTTAALSLDVETRDGAVVEFVLDGERVGPLRDVWRPTPRALPVELGVHALAPGEHVLDVVFLEDTDARLAVEALVLERR